MIVCTIFFKAEAQAVAWNDELSSFSSVLKIKIENADVNRKFSRVFFKILQSIYAKALVVQKKRSPVSKPHSLGGQSVSNKD